MNLVVCLLTNFLFLTSKQNIQLDEIPYDSDFPRQLQLTSAHEEPSQITHEIFYWYKSDILSDDQD